MTTKSKIITIVCLAFLPLISHIIAQFYSSFLLALPLKIFIHIIVPIVAVMIIRKVSLTESILLPITREWKPEAKKFAYKITIVGIVLAVAIIWIAYKTLGIYVDFDNLVLDLQNKYGITTSTFILVALWITFVNPIFEEFFWRGFVFRGISQFAKSQFSKWLIIISSGILFSIHHAIIVLEWFNVWLFIATLTFLSLAGMLFNWIYSKTGSIIPALIIHMFADAIICIIGLIIFNII